MDDSTKTGLAPIEQDLKTDLDADKKLFVDQGHQLIADGMASAQRIAERYPNNGMPALIQTIEQTLRGLFSHLVDPQPPAPAPVVDPAVPEKPATPPAPVVTKDPTLKVQG